MPSFKQFVKRINKSQEAVKQELYSYDNLPNTFRVQTIHILREVVGVFISSFRSYDYSSSGPVSNQIWEAAWKTLIKEFGLFYLGKDSQEYPDIQIFKYLMDCDIQHALFIIETVLATAKRFTTTNQYDPEFGRNLVFEEGIRELNQRFEENAIGYEYISGALIRKDTQFIHNEVVKPAIILLNDVGFSGPLEEFLNAFKFYRQDDKKQAIAEESKAFESTMKAICSKKHWAFDPHATAVPLINVLIDNGLIPKELLSHFTSLQALLQNGLPTLSNKTSRHGQGIEPREIERYIVEYALSLCASNILFLIKAYKLLK
jgi:hypothetical protein